MIKKCASVGDDGKIKTEGGGAKSSLAAAAAAAGVVGFVLRRGKSESEGEENSRRHFSYSFALVHCFEQSRETRENLGYERKFIYINFHSRKLTQTKTPAQAQQKHEFISNIKQNVTRLGF